MTPTMTSAAVHAAGATLVLLAGFLACTPLPPSGSAVDTSSECGSLDRFLAPAHPEPGMARALRRVRACPESAGRALADAVAEMQAIGDTVELERRTWLTHYVVDQRIVDAALAVAADDASATEARVYALRTLIWQKAPGHLINRAMITGPAPGPEVFGTWSSYTNHYYTDLGYGTGENPWPVLGMPPADAYVERMHRVIEAMPVSGDDEPLANARAWFLWYAPDAQLIELLRDAGSRRFD